MKRIVSMLLACVLLLCCISGCGAKNNDDNNTTGDLKELDVVLDWYPNALHAFMYVAMEKGYYADEGLKINIRFPSNANDAISLVAAGQADIGLYYQQDVIQVPIFRNAYRGDYCPLFSQRIFYLVGCPVGSKYTIKVNLPGKVAALPGRFLFY